MAFVGVVFCFIGLATALAGSHLWVVWTCIGLAFTTISTS